MNPAAFAMVNQQQMPSVQQNMASLEAAMMMQQASNDPGGNKWTRPIIQKNMRKEALGLEKQAQQEAEDKALKKQMTDRKKRANLVGTAYGMDMSDPDSVAKAAGLARLIEMKAPAEVIKSALVRLGLEDEEDDGAAGKILTTEAGMRKEFNALLVDYQKVNRAYGRVQASTQNPSPAGDLSLIFNYMKMLDPGSVVRESEFATAAKAGDFGDRIGGMVNRVTNGKRLTEDQRSDFITKAGELYVAAQDSAQNSADAYTTIGTNAGVNVDNIIANYTTSMREIEEGKSPNTSQENIYKTEAEVFAAVGSGALSIGDTVIVNGQELVIEEE